MTLSFSISHRFSHHGPGSVSGRAVLLCRYSANRPSGSPPSAIPPPPFSAPAGHNEKGKALMKERLLAAVRCAAVLGQRWAQRSTQTASATMNYWWGKYEEFVGLNEVREAQAKVTEAEAAFMVARGLVRDSHAALEALQSRLKEVRVRLDRVSREEAQYLELATMEHKLLQEERRHRSDYEKTEICEREKFALFSAAVRASHEKERTRAERTKNWSVIGSVLGALIGVMGSTYINHVRLQELKNLLLEAQRGPQSLQEALRVQAGIHQSQQEQLQSIIHGLKNTVTNAITATGEHRSSNEGLTLMSSLEDLHICNQKTQSAVNSLMPQLRKLEQGLDRLERRLLPGIPGLETPQEPLQTLVEHQKRHSSVFSFTAATAITVATLYLMFRAATG